MKWRKYKNYCDLQQLGIVAFRRVDAPSREVTHTNDNLYGHLLDDHTNYRLYELPHEKGHLLYEMPQYPVAGGHNNFYTSAISLTPLTFTYKSKYRPYIPMAPLCGVGPCSRTPSGRSCKSFAPAYS